MTFNSTGFQAAQTVEKKKRKLKVWNLCGMLTITGGRKVEILPSESQVSQLYCLEVQTL